MQFVAIKYDNIIQLVPKSMETFDPVILPRKALKRIKGGNWAKPQAASVSHKLTLNRERKLI